MIVLKPDQKCKERFGKKIDFKTLSLVYSMLYNSVCKDKKQKNYTIRIYTTSGLFSYYAWQNGCNVRINISDIILDINQFNRTLLHEFRHLLQDKVLKIPLTKKNYDDSTDQKYMSSPIEIDAENYERTVLPKVMHLYKQLLKFNRTVKTISGYKGK